MREPSVIHSTFTIERSFNKPPERVFAAFADAAKKRHWYAEGETSDVEDFTFDFRPGGAETLRKRMNQKTPFPGTELFYDNRFEDIVPNERIVTTSTMSFAGKRVSATLVTIEFLATDKGTDMIFTHQGAFFPGSDGPQMREAGWRSIIERLGAELAK